MTIFLPKQIVPLNPTTESPLLFLAGPIRGGGDWQSVMAEEIFAREPKALIACPSRWTKEHRLAEQFDQPFSPAENRQLVWERHYLKLAGLEPRVPGCVIFWLGLESVDNPHPGPEPYAMDTRRELGKFTAYAEVVKEFSIIRHRLEARMVVGGDTRFHGLDVLLFELREAFNQQFPFYGTMGEVAAAALKVARQ